MNEKTSVSGGASLTAREKLPFVSLIVPITRPFTWMFTPARVSPEASETVPETEVCPKAIKVVKSRNAPDNPERL
jgi:hypothetical protein